jgi:tetratricopeptide (TPR) repeat protein
MMAKRKRSPEKKTTSRKQKIHVTHLSYEVTYDSIEDPDYEQLPEDVQAIFEELYHQISLDPAGAIPEILYWKTQYPDLPKLHNFLSAAYSHLGDRVNLRANIEATYQAFPQYLFARINYAELCLHEKKYDQIPHIFNNIFDLKFLYPERTQFHVSEFGGFVGVIGLYYYHTKQYTEAQQQYTLCLLNNPGWLGTYQRERVYYRLSECCRM